MNGFQDLKINQNLARIVRTGNGMRKGIKDEEFNNIDHYLFYVWVL